MGMFSACCACCGLPISSESIVARHEPFFWITEAVAVSVGGDVIARGPYDGYGRLEGIGVVGIDDCSVYHAACFDKIPRRISGSDLYVTSPYDRTQGMLTGPDEGTEMWKEIRQFRPQEMSELAFMNYVAATWLQRRSDLLQRIERNRDDPRRLSKYQALLKELDARSKAWGVYYLMENMRQSLGESL